MESPKKEKKRGDKKMSSLPTLPLFLQKDYLSNLNNQLFDKTGCFAFLCTDTVLCVTEPKSWQDAFSIIVPGLYSVYHDYGCLFLMMIIDKKKSSIFQPDGLQIPNYIWKHISIINAILRPNLTHGILYHLQRENFQKSILSFYVLTISKRKHL